jgi:hypothetical protein
VDLRVRVDAVEEHDGERRDPADGVETSEAARRKYRRLSDEVRHGEDIMASRESLPTHVCPR